MQASRLSVVVYNEKLIRTLQVDALNNVWTGWEHTSRTGETMWGWKSRCCKILLKIFVIRFNISLTCCMSGDGNEMDVWLMIRAVETELEQKVYPVWFKRRL